jgi:hypothetical protein
MGMPVVSYEPRVPGPFIETYGDTSDNVLGHRLLSRSGDSG